MIRFGFALSLSLCLGITITAQAAAAAATDNVKADRSPLGFRDRGLYCNFGTPNANPAVAKRNLLPNKRAATSAPWSFYIVQFNASRRRKFDPAAPSVQKQVIRDMARHGKRVILRVGIWNHDLPRLGNKLPPHAADIAFHRLEQALAAIKPQWLYAITLGEENIPWFGHAKVLTELYHRAKKRWPNLPVYQWWTPMRGIDWTGRTGFKPLPADGWILDLYNMSRDLYEKRVISFLHTGKPLIAILWASPSWPFGRHKHLNPAFWWKRYGLPAMRGQLDVCQAYNIPVAYFAAQNALIKNGKLIHPIYWAWNATDPVTRAFYQSLELRAREAPFIPDDMIGYRKVTAAKVRWSQATPVELHLSRQAGGDIKAVWIDRLGKPALTVGSHQRPHRNPYFAISYTLNNVGAKNLEHGGDGFAITSIDKRALRVPIIFKIQPRKPVSHLSVDLTIRRVKPLGGSYQLRTSFDGQPWSKPIAAAPSKNVVTLNIKARKPATAEPLYLKLTLIANAGVKTRTACALQAIKVIGTFP